MGDKMSDKTNYSRMTFWQLLSGQKVEIPIIQRDYAQGRPEQEHIRRSFVDALFKSFDEHEIELDFIYGNPMLG